MELKKYNTIEVHISTISNGDTIIHSDGFVRTVNNNNIKCSFMGITIFGDSYKLGTLPISKIVIGRG